MCALKCQLCQNGTLSLYVPQLIYKLAGVVRHTQSVRVPVDLQPLQLGAVLGQAYHDLIYVHFG